MRRRLAMPARSLTLLTLGALAAALLLAAGCGGDAKKLVGTWQFDTGMTGEKAQDFSATMTLNSDGTGTMEATQTITEEMPATQSQKFEWEIKDKQFVISMPDQGVPQKADGSMPDEGASQKADNGFQADYEFQKDGTLSISIPEGPTMKYTRVE